MEGVMNNSGEYHQSVLEALCAFVRDNTIGKPVASEVATDVQAALTVIGRRRHKWDSGDLDLASANVPKAYLREAFLMGAHLNGANLNGADMIGVNVVGANLRGAELSGAHLNGADLRGAHLNDAYLNGAVLMGAFLNNADLTAADLNGANLSGADLRGANLTGTDLTGANLSEALVDVETRDIGLTYEALREAMNRSQVQLDRACGADVTLPGGNMRDLKPCH